MTGLVEPWEATPEGSATEMHRAFLKALEHTSAMAIMSTFPDASSSGLYTHWSEKATSAQKTIVIDASKGIEGFLKVPGTHSMLKMNRLDPNRLTDQATAESAFQYAMGMRTACVLPFTNGLRSLYTEERRHPVQVIHIPKWDNVLNLLLSEDMADAIFPAEYVHPTTSVDAFRVAVAATTVNCCQWNASVFLPNYMRSIGDGITIK